MLQTTAAGAAFRQARKAAAVAIPQQQRRGMAGGFPGKMGVKKNVYIEEWGGFRESCEKRFEFTASDIPTFLITLVFFPLGLYYISRTELKMRDRRFKEVF
ncbi:hypothetical protein ACA910_016010 [Epithemia clementina (nom. ined.)]